MKLVPNLKIFWMTQVHCQTILSKIFSSVEEVHFSCQNEVFFRSLRAFSTHQYCNFIYWSSNLWYWRNPLQNEIITINWACQNFNITNEFEVGFISNEIDMHPQWSISCGFFPWKTNWSTTVHTTYLVLDCNINRGFF